MIAWHGLTDYLHGTHIHTTLALYVVHATHTTTYTRRRLPSLTPPSLTLPSLTLPSFSLTLAHAALLLTNPRSYCPRSHCPLLPSKALAHTALAHTPLARIVHTHCPLIQPSPTLALAHTALTHTVLVPTALSPTSTRSYRPGSPCQFGSSDFADTCAHKLSLPSRSHCSVRLSLSLSSQNPYPVPVRAPNFIILCQILRLGFGPRVFIKTE